MQKLLYSTYYDKVYGGWFGKCLGGAAGAPVEGIKNAVDHVNMRELLDPNLPNDDLDLQLLWLEVLEKKGPYLNADDISQAWVKQCWYPFGEYGVFLRNYKRGIHPPFSGKFNNYYFYEGMGCPIRSEIWAMINPGNPEAATNFAKMDGTLDHEGNSVWAEVFLAALESLCFVSDDLIGNINQALTYVTEDCKFLRCVNMVIAEYHKGTAFKDILRRIQIDYSHPDFTNSIQNMGYTVLALLFGERDIEKTINYALACGYDADCTCASAAAVIGILEGYDKLADDLKAMLNDRYVCGIDVVRSDDTISTLSLDTCMVGVEFSDHYNALTIEMDGGQERRSYSWEKPHLPVEFTVTYEAQPGVGIGLDCPVQLHIRNNTTREQQGTLMFTNIPESLELRCDDTMVTMAPMQTLTVPVVIAAKASTKEFAQTNILNVQFVGGGEVLGAYDFGVIGAVVWNIYGPFIEQRVFEIDPELPPCHGGVSTLPPVETMFANMALPDKEYLDESHLLSDTESFDVTRIINAVDDIIDVDSCFGLSGEAVFYAATDIVFDEAATKWIVCGNSDAYKLWVNGELIQNFDEYRNWQPQTHGHLVQFRKGANRVVIKLVRRAQTMRFTFGIREFTTKHYHAQQWTTEYRSKQIVQG